jgi:hypothetical protein
MKPREIRTALKARGVELAKPASEQQIETLQKALKISLDPFFRNLLYEFDGFESYDDNNKIHLWSIQDIIKERNEKCHFNGRQYHAIGDFLIHSDLIVCCLDCEAAPVFYQCEQLQLGSNASDFFAKLIAGEFDF